MPGLEISSYASHIDNGMVSTWSAIILIAETLFINRKVVVSLFVQVECLKFANTKTCRKFTLALLDVKTI